MKRKGLWVALASVALLLLATGCLLAAPQPPKLVVNHETKQCAEIFGGDECMDCDPPPGWEILGYVDQHECPADYTFVEDLDYTCQGFKDEFCCTEGHSGAAGDCEDLIVNHRTDQCAFVDDITDCALPQRWEKRSDNVDPYRWTCPGDYEWIADVNCAQDTGAGAADRTEKPSDDDARGTERLDDRDIRTITTGFIIALVVIVLVFALWFLVRKNLLGN